MARAADRPSEPEDKPRIRVTRNGEIYVTAEDVVKSPKFREQLEKMAKIPVTRGPVKLR